MTNNSGKFREIISHKAADMQKPDEKEYLENPPEDNSGDGEDGGDPDRFIPDVPQDTMAKLKYYLGEWWWLWIVAVIVYLARKK